MTRDPRLKDFRNFLYVVWKHLNLPEPTPVQYRIAYYLQHGPRRLMVQAFRGVGKSWITAAFVLWLLYWDPQLRIIVASASQERATKFTTFVLQLIRDIEILRFLEPGDDDRRSTLSFDVAPAAPDQAPSVCAFGITGQMTGSRGDVIIADDVESLNNSDTVIKREKLSETVKEFDAILKPEGRVIYLGTPQTEDTMYKALEERGYEVRIYPSRYPEESKIYEVYGNSLDPFIEEELAKNAELVGLPTDPQRFNDFDLTEREASYGRSGFALQFQLDTRLSDQDRYPLKLSDLIVLDCDTDIGPEKVTYGSGPDQVIKDLPCVGFRGDRYHNPISVSKEYAAYTGSVMTIDPAGRGKDETGFAVTKMLNGQIFVLECSGYMGGYDEKTLTRLAETAKKYKVNSIQIESNFGDGMFLQLFMPVLRRIYPVTCEEIRHNTQKEKRIIDALEPVLCQHKLIVDKSLITKDFHSVNEISGIPKEQVPLYRLFFQLSRLTREKGSLAHDDRLEALAMGVQYWTDSMAQDIDQNMKDREEQRMMDAIHKLDGSWRLENEKSGPSWLDSCLN